jgi:transcriptional regulator with XRE-family HTH domain/tetratricopeptide (TPR) repeat protein
VSEASGAWLRQQREARRWTRLEMARQLIAAGRAKGDTLPGTDSMCHNIHRWESGQGGLTERYKLHYCTVLGISPAQFGADPDSRPEPSGPRLPISPAVAYRGRQDPAVEREVLMAAHEGSERAEQAERRDIGDATLEQLHADVARLSVESMTGEPFPLFREMRRVRSRLYRLLDGQLRPGDRTDLYFLLGCLSDLMAVAASGLGYPRAAEELIRSGWAYATAIDHRPLMAHLRLQLASVVFWQNRPRQARQLAQDGLRYLQDGPNAAHLHVKYARAAARLGDVEDARQAIIAAQDAREREHADDVLAMGGEFGLSQATQSYFSGSALAEIQGAEGEAAEHLDRAVSLYEAGPGPDEQHWFGGKALAGIDLAAIQLRGGALDAALAALESPLSLPAAQRINAVTTRLDLVRTELAAPVFQHSPRARELDERIEEFGQEAIAAELHSLSGGTG